MKKILVPTDFSKPATIATETAAEIARKSGAQLILLHIVEGVSESSFNITGEMGKVPAENKLFMLKLIERSKKQLEKAAENPKLKGIRVKQELRMGTAFHGMRTIIAEQKVDLVVMGTSGRSQ